MVGKYKQKKKVAEYSKNWWKLRMLRNYILWLNINKKNLPVEEEEHDNLFLNINSNNECRARLDSDGSIVVVDSFIEIFNYGCK